MIGDSIDWHRAYIDKALRDSKERQDKERMTQERAALLNKHSVSDLSGLAARESAVPRAKAQGATDPIRPSHYDLGLGHGLEVMDLIRANADGLTGFQGFAFGNILKYVLRFRRKNGLEDLLKAKTYLDQLIQSLQDASVDPNTTRHSHPTHKTQQRPAQEASAP